MVLQQQAAFRLLAEIWPVLVFAVGNQSAEHLAETVKLDDFLTIEPVLDFPVVRYEPALVPPPYIFDLLCPALGRQVLCRDQVVQ